MSNANAILCAVDPAAPEPALAQAVHLAVALDATLYVMEQCPAPSSSLSAQLDQYRTASPHLSATLLDTPTAAEESDAPPVLATAHDLQADLLVTDTPPDRGALPILAAAPTRDYALRCSHSLFVVEHEAEPATVERLLVPVDFSDGARSALQTAVELARVYDASIDLLHVIEHAPYVALSPMDRLSLSDTTLSERRARHRLSTFLKEISLGDVSVTPHFTHGNAADQIGRAVEEQNADLLVLSAHGTDAPPASPLGAVAETVLGRVTCPLVLVRP
jgi:nucleotide-binding universal stress UspA family protein